MKQEKQDQNLEKGIARKIKEIGHMTEIKITNNVLMIIAVMLILVNSVTFVLTSKDMVSGKATGEARICIGQAPRLGELGPSGGSVIRGLYNISIQGFNTSRVTFRYFRFGSSIEDVGTDYDTDNDTWFNYTWNTSNVSDGNCNFRLRAEGYGYCDVKTINSSGSFSIDNNPTEPTWTEFKNNLSTNFSQYSIWTDISDAEISVPDKGKIKFLSTKNFDSANLDRMFNISQNLITINSTEWCFRDQVFGIAFYNSSGFVEPIVLRGSSPCGSACYNYNITNETFEFVTRVIDDANFSLVEGANITLNLTLAFDGESVNLNWSYELPGNWSSPPDYYNIYYSDNATEMLELEDFGTPNVSGLTNEEWIDYTANVTGERYYVVTAVKGTREVRAAETGCKYDVQVYPGQNLVSLPCNVEPIPIDDNVLPGEGSYYDRIVRHVPGSGFQRTDYYGTTWKWWGAFEEVESKRGYYMYPTKKAYEIVDVGLIPVDNQTINISKGTNLVGWPSVYSKNISDVLNPGNNSWYDSIQRYNSTTSWERVDYYGPTWKWWGWFTYFDPGRGYWYYPVNDSYTWEFDPLP